VTQLDLAASHLDRMRAHVESCLPLEACGLLAGTLSTVLQVIPVANAARSPVRFQMEPREQLAALDHIEAGGLELLGIFHSHPDGPGAPSATDIAEAAYPVVYVIWWRPRGLWEARGFWIERERLTDVKLHVVADPA